VRLMAEGLDTMFSTIASVLSGAVFDAINSQD
jgi:hypothetical protein